MVLNPFEKVTGWFNRPPRYYYYLAEILKKQDGASYQERDIDELARELYRLSKVLKKDSKRTERA